MLPVYMSGWIGLGTRLMKDEGKCIFIGFVYYQLYLDASGIRRATRKFRVVECCYWKELAEVRSHR